MIYSIVEFLWAGIVSLAMVIAVGGFFYWAGNPSSAHNVAYRKFEQDCKDKGGMVLYARTNRYRCVNKDYFIEVK